MSHISNQRIFLIGFMGCGKSKLGKSVAQKFDRPFIDLDELIESQSQMTIPQLFAVIGEQGFREKEREVLQNSAFAKDIIIATGGGAPCFFDNMEWMNNNGITVFIDSPVKVLADRLINARVERPLVKGKNKEELIEYIEVKLVERRPFYEQARIILKGEDLNADILIQELEEIND
jgi:shikimate kinase